MNKYFNTLSPYIVIGCFIYSAIYSIDHDVTLVAARGPCCPSSGTELYYLRSPPVWGRVSCYCCPSTKQHAARMLRGGMDRGGGAWHYLSGGELYDADPRWHKYHWQAIVITLTWPDSTLHISIAPRRSAHFYRPNISQESYVAAQHQTDTIKNWINRGVKCPQIFGIPHFLCPRGSFL